MKNLATDRSVSVNCVAVKLRPGFPSLLPSEGIAVAVSFGPIDQAFADCGAACNDLLTSLPRFEIFASAALLLLATVG